MPSTSKLAVCGDGMSVAKWEQAGAAKKGISVEQWRKEVADTLGSATKSDVAEAFGKGKSAAAKGYAKNAGTLAENFNSVSKAFADPAAKTKTPTAWGSSDQLQDLLEGKVPGFSQYGGNGSGYNDYKRPMWWYLWTKGYVVEADWQHETTVSWVDASTGRKVYVSPETPYAVTRPNTDFVFPIGSIVKLAPSTGGAPTYAQVLESGPGIVNPKTDQKNNKLELSSGSWDRLGYPEGSGLPKDYSLNYSQVTKGGFPGAAGTQLTGDQIQLAGALGDSGMLSRSGGAISVNDLSNSLKKNNITPDKIPEKLKKSLNDGAKKALEDLDAQAKEKAKQASAGGGGGGRYLLAKGFPTVATGKTQRLVGYANTACLHTGGGYVMEGSSTVYVGQFPLARVDDNTSDGYAVLTGDDTVFVGGPPTSAMLA